MGLWTATVNIRFTFPQHPHAVSTTLLLGTSFGFRFVFSIVLMCAVHGRQRSEQIEERAAGVWH